jgi:hypothetical protein
MKNQTVKRYVLKGHFQGRTVMLGGFSFVEGALLAQLSEEDHVKLARHLSQWSAEVDDGECSAQEDSTRAVDSNLQPNGEGPAAGGQTDDGSKPASTPSGNTDGRLGAQGDRQTEELNPTLRRIREAVLGLDPAVAGNWTRDGKPALPAVERAVGFAGLTRAQLDAVCGGYTLKEARQVYPERQQALASLKRGPNGEVD